MYAKMIVLTESARDAGANRKKSLPTRVKAPSKTNIGFTFVDQSEDLRSLADKRIVSSSQRHAIRSHVMKSVRHSENLIGKKRPTGRETSRRVTTKTLKALPFLEASVTAIEDITNDTTHSTLEIINRRPRMQMVRIPPDPSSRLDPFFVLPGNDGSSYALIETLVRYCFEVFLPMTFPVEKDADNQVSSRKGVIMKSKISNPGSFFGMMAIVAAHRAITSKRHYDLKPSNFDHGLLLFDDEYAKMKDCAIRTTRTTTMEKAAVDNDSMEATFSLIGAATIIGNFQEARIYLAVIRQNLNGSRHLDATLPVYAFIPMSDVKAASGMMTRPLFDYPWSSEDDLRLLFSKVTPSPGTAMTNTAKSLYRLNRSHGLDWDLSLGMLEALRVTIAVFWFGQATVEKPRSLSQSDHEIFRKKSVEMEHTMLSYVYKGDDDTQPMSIHPIEHMIRLNVLAFASSFLTQALPSAGLGRALTHQQLEAHRSYLQSLLYGSIPTILEKQCVAWCMFQFIHGAYGQPEESTFINVLAELLTDLQISTWEQVESMLLTFLYIPAWQQKPWIRIWQVVECFMERRNSPSSWTSSPSV